MKALPSFFFCKTYEGELLLIHQPQAVEEQGSLLPGTIVPVALNYSDEGREEPALAKIVRILNAHWED